MAAQRRQRPAREEARATELLHTLCSLHCRETSEQHDPLTLFNAHQHSFLHRPHTHPLLSCSHDIRKVRGYHINALFMTEFWIFSGIAASRSGIEDEFKISERIQRKCKFFRFICEYSWWDCTAHASLIRLRMKWVCWYCVTVVREKREKDAVTFLELNQRLSAQVRPRDELTFDLLIIAFFTLTSLLIFLRS